MNDQQQEFRLGEAFFQNFRRVTLTRTLPLMLLAGAAGFFMTRTGSDLPAGFGMATGGAILLMIAYSMRRSYRQQTERLRGFRVLLSAEGLRRNQPGLAEVFLHADQICRVVEYPGRSLTVHGPTPAQLIAIPATIEGFQQIRQILETWCPVEIGTSWSLAGQAPALSGVATLAALVTVYRSENAAIVTALGVALIGVLAWAFLSLRSNPNLDAKTKRSVWFVLLPMFAVAARVWSLWAG